MRLSTKAVGLLFIGGGISLMMGSIVPISITIIFIGIATLL